MAKYLLTKDMYVKLRDLDGTKDIARCCKENLVLSVSSAYRVVDGKMVKVPLDEVGRG